MHPQAASTRARLRRLSALSALTLALLSPSSSESARPGGGRAPVVTRVRVHPAPGKAAAMAGGRIAGSNLGQTLGFVELATIDKAPREGQWIEIRLDNDRPYRFVKYEGPDGSRGAIAEVEFYAGQVKLTGKGFGVAGHHRPEGGKGKYTYPHALDGDTSTWFNAPIADGAYVGIDVGTDENTVPRPTIEPAGGTFDKAPAVTIKAPHGASVRYTLDGSIPTPTHGQAPTGPIRLTDGVVTLRAVAFSKGKFASPLSAASYRVGPDAKGERVVSYHIGNSLSDTFINGYLEAVSTSAGHDHLVCKFSIPGAPTDWLWNHPGTGFGIRLPESRINTNNVHEGFPAAAPVDHLTTQPFSGHGRSIANEAEHSGKFYALCRESSPDVQMWLYSQWPGREFKRDGWSMLKQGYMKELADKRGLTPATSWQEGCRNHMAYFEAVRERMNEQFDGKDVRIIPTALALANLKDAVDAGAVPGITSDTFFELHYGKGTKGPGYNIHMIDKGRYFVSLVVYCSLFGRSAEAVDLPAKESGLTDDQEAIYKRIAWRTVASYPHAGLARGSGHGAAKPGEPKARKK